MKNISNLREGHVLCGLSFMGQLRANIKRLFTVTALIFALLTGLVAQPVWQNGTPTFTAFNALTGELTVNLDAACTIYYFISQGNITNVYAGSSIRGIALRGEGGGTVVNYTTPGVNQTFYVQGYSPNRTVSIFVAAGNASGLQATGVTLHCTTPPATSPNNSSWTQSFSNDGQCVNIGATGEFWGYVPPNRPAQTTGLYAGSVWTITWGDGTTQTYTSATDNDIPALTHDYNTTNDCVYLGTWAVVNPAGLGHGGSNPFVVHGRDIPADGDGALQIVNDATGVANVLELCEGQEYTVVLRDNSTWNCQNPRVFEGFTAAPNSDPRTLQWVYGKDPLISTVGGNNTITGTVVVGGSNNTTSAAGYDGNINIDQTAVGLLSQTITIPATSVAGQEYRVWIKNWNKCNSYPGNTPVYTDFVIRIIDAPDAPVVADREVCYSERTNTTSKRLTVTNNSPTYIGGTMRWYSNESLTTLVGTGMTYSPAATTTGTHRYWVRYEVTGGCSSPATEVTLTIRNNLAQPGTITAVGVPVCATGGSLTLSLPSAPGSQTYGGQTEYVWTLPAGWVITGNTAGNQSITVAVNSIITATTVQQVSVSRRYVNAASTGNSCPSQARTLNITVVPPSLGGTISGTTSICSGTRVSLTLSGNRGEIVQWERKCRIGGAWEIRPNTTNTNDDGLGTVATWYYRVLVRNSPCDEVYSAEFAVNVVAAPVGGTTSGGNGTICLGSTTGNITLSGYSGTIASWQRSTNGVTWSNIYGTAGSTSYYETPASAGTFQYRAVISRGPCGDAYSTATTVVVNPVSVGGVIRNASNVNTMDVCVNESTVTLTLSRYVGTILRWERSANNWVTVDNLGNAGNTTYTDTRPTAGTYRYRAVVQSGVCAPAYSSIMTVNVSNPPAGSLDIANTRICEDGSVSLTATMTSGYIGAWRRQYSADGVTWGSSYVQVSTSSSLTYSEQLTTSGYYRYWVRMRSAGCDSQNSNTVTVRVDPTTVPGSVTGGTEICHDSNSGTLSLGTHTGIITRWQYRQDNGTNQTTWSSWTDIANTMSTYTATSLDAAIGNTVVQHYQYRAMVQSGVCSEMPSDATTVTVYPTTRGGSVSGPNAICYDAGSTGTMTLSGHIGRVLRWQRQHNSTTGTWEDLANTSTTFSQNTPLTAGTWYYRAVVQSGTACGVEYSVPHDIIVYPQFNSAQIAAAATSICNGTSTNLSVTLTGGTSPYTVNYTRSFNSGAAIAQTALTSYISGSTFSTGNLTTGEYTYTITSVTDANGCSVENSGTPIIVSVGTTPATATLTGNGNVCYGTESTISSFITGGAADYTFSYTVSRNGSTPTPYTITYAGDDSDISLGTLAVGAYVVRITSIVDQCGATMPEWGHNINYTFNVNAIPDISGTSGMTAPICNGSATAITLASTVTNTDIRWTTSIVTPGASTVTGLANSTTDVHEGSTIAQTLSHTYTFPVTVRYTISSDGPGTTNCAGNTITRDVVINPVPQVNNIDNRVVCNGDNTALIDFASANTGGTNSFRWSNNNTSIGLVANGTGNIATFEATNTGTAPVVATITVTPVFTNGGVECVGDASTQKTFTITVNPTVTMEAVTSQTVCNAGDNVSAITFDTDYTGSTGTVSYSWVNNTPSIGLVATGNGDIAAFQGLNANSSPVTATITVTPTLTNGGISCQGNPTNFTITVNPTVTVDAIANQVVCNNGNTTAVTFASAGFSGGSISYSWSNNNTSIGLAASGTNVAGISAFTALNTGTAPVMATITVTPTFTNNGVSCTGTPRQFTITVNPTAQVNDPADLVLCNGISGGAVTFVTTRTGGETSYAWSNNNTAIGLGGSGTGNIAAFTPTNGGTAPITATITVTPTFTNGGQSCSGASQTFTITVNPTVTVDAIENQVLCAGNNSTLVTFGSNYTGGVGTVSYRWENSNEGIGLAASGNTSNLAAFATTNNTNAPITGTITVTPTLSNGGNLCEGTPTTFTITVNPTAQVNDPADLVLCNGIIGGAVTFVTTRTGGTTTYAWSNDNTAIGLGASGTGNIADFTPTNAGTAPITATITVTPTFENGTVSCSGTSQTFTITVNPTAQVDDPTDLVLCNGISGGAVTFATTRTGGTTTYEWSNDNTAIDLGASGTGNIAAFTPRNTGTAPVTATITVTPTFENGGIECVGDASTQKTFTITVNPTAQVNAITDQVLCNGSGTTAITFGTDRTVGVTTYSWTNTEPTIGLPASGTTDNIPSFTATNTGTAPVIASIEVTPTFTYGDVSCTGPSETFTITVNPTAQANDPGDRILCWGAASGDINFTTNNTVGATTYTWTNDNTNIDLGTNGNGNILSFNGTNTTTAPITGTIAITPTFTYAGEGCPGPVTEFNVTVNPRAQVDDPDDQAVCNNASTTAIHFTTQNTGGNTRYTWTNNTASIDLAASGNGNIDAFTATNSGTATVTATITVTPHYTNLNGGAECSGPVQTFTITVYPTPELSSTLTPAAICSNNIFAYTPTSATTGTTYSWTRGTLPTGVTAAGTGSGNSADGTANISETLRNFTSTTQTVTYEYVLSANGCTNTQTVTATVRPEPVISNQTPGICSGQPFTWRILLDNFANPGDNVTFTWPAPVHSVGLSGGTARTTPSAADMSDVFLNTTGTSGTVTYTVTPYYGGCPGEAKEIVVSIGSQPVLGDLDMDACSNTAIGLTLGVAPSSSAADRYYVNSITLESGLGTVSGHTNATVLTRTMDAKGVSASYLSNDMYLNLTGRPLTVTYNVTPAYGADCVGADENIVVTINPQPVIVPGQVKTVCSDVPINYEILLDPRNTPAGTTFSWDAPTISDGSTQGTAVTGLAADPAGTLHITDFIHNTTGAPITATYNVTPTSADGCAGYTIPVVITINPEPLLPVIRGDLVLCEGAINKVYSVDNHAGNSYRWGVTDGLDMTVNADLYFIAVEAIGGADAVDTVWNYEIMAGTGCVSDTAFYEVRVVSVIPGVAVTGPTEICLGETGTYSVPYNDGSVYSWIVPAGAVIVSDPTLHEIDVQFNVAVTNASLNVVEQTNGACTTSHLGTQVTVNPLPTAYAVTAPVAYCDGETGVAVTLSGSETGVNYQLYKDSGTGAVAEGSVIAGTGAALTWGNMTIGTYTVVATNATTSCVQDMSGSPRVVLNTVNGGTIQAAQAVCPGVLPAPFTSTVAAVGAGAITYQWQLSTDNQSGSGTFTNISGATSEELSPNSINADTWFRRVAYSTMEGNVVCEAVSNIVFVNAINFDPGTITDDQTVCYNSPVAGFTQHTVPSVTDGDGETLTYLYQWQVSTDGFNFTNISGANAEDYAPDASILHTQDTWYRREVTATLLGASCTKYTPPVRVTVVNFMPGSISSDQILCSNPVTHEATPAALTSISATGDGTFTYQWEYSTDNISWTNVSDADGGKNEIFTPYSLSGTTYFRRQAISVLNTACSQPSNVVMITLMNFNPGTISGEQTICNGDNVASAFTNTPASSMTSDTYNFVYQWQRSVGGGSFNNIIGANAADYTPTEALYEDTRYRRMVTAVYGSRQCVDYSNEILVTVNNITAGTVSGGHTICDTPGAAVNALTYSGSTGEAGATVSHQWYYSTDNWTTSTAIGSVNDTELSVVTLGTITQDTRYRVVVTSERNGVQCTDISNDVLITVINFDPGTIEGDQVICDNSAAATLTSVSPSGDGTFTYRWFSSTDNFVTTNDVIAGAVSETYNPGIVINDTYYRREVTARLNGVSCTQVTNSVYVEVNKVTAGVVGPVQYVCEGEAPATSLSETTAATADGTMTYQWYSSVDGSSFTVVSDPLDVNYGKEATLDVPALNEDTWYRRDVTSTIGTESCTVEGTPLRIYVNNFTAGTIEGSQTICNGSTPIAFTGTLAIGDGTKTYQWQYYNDTHDAWENVTGGTGATSANYTSAALNVTTRFRRITTSTLGTAVCYKESNAITVTVIAFNQGAAGSNQVICEGDTPALLDVVTAPSAIDGTTGYNYTYQWQYSFDNITYYNIAGAVNATYQPDVPVQDTYFRRRVTAELGGYTCSLVTTPVLVDVNIFTVGTLTMNQTISEGDVPDQMNYSGTTGDGGIFGLQWQYSNDGVTFNDIAGETGNSYTPAALSNDVTYRIMVTSNYGGSSCVKYSNNVTITVINFEPGSLAGDQIICSGSTPTGLVFNAPTGDGVFTYHWYYSEDGGTVWTALPGGTNETFIPQILTADRWYRRDVTATLNTVTDTKTTNELRIYVNNVTGGTITDDQTICENDQPATLTFTTAATGDGTLSYRWLQSTDGITYTSAEGTNDQITYTPPTLTNDSWYKVETTSTYSVGGLSAVTCTAESNEIAITVINFEAGNINGTQTVCEGERATILNGSNASGDGVKSYRWESTTTDPADPSATWAVVAGATGISYRPEVLTVNTWFRRISRATMPNGAWCEHTSDEILVTVNSFTPGVIEDAQTICEGATPAELTVTTAPTKANAAAVITYQWQNSSDGTNFVNISNADAETYQPGGLTRDTWFRRMVTSTLNGKECYKYTNDVKVTVNNFEPGEIGNNQVICNGGTVTGLTFTTAATGDETLAYQWQTSTDGATFTDIVGEESDSYTPTGVGVDTWYRVKVTAPATPSCEEYTNEVKITVITLNAGSLDGDQVICARETPSGITFNPASTTNGNLVYRWEYSDDNGANWVNLDNGNSAEFIPTALNNDRWYRRNVTVTIGATICSEVTNDLKIYVNNVTGGAIGADQIICDNTVPDEFTVTTAATGDATSLIYRWYSSTTNETTGFTLIAGATAATYQSPALTEDTWFRRDVESAISVGSLNSSCFAQSNVVKVTVVNFLRGTIGSDQTIHTGETPSAFTSVAASGDGVKSYQWQNSADGVTFINIVGATNATYAAGPLTQDAWYRRIDRATVTDGALTRTCEQITNAIKVTVISFDPGTISAAQTICEGAVPSLLNGTEPTPSATYSYSYQWQSRTATTSYANIPGAIGQNYQPGALTEDTWFIRQVTARHGSTTYTLPSVNEVLVTVNNFVPGIIGGTATICEGGSLVTNSLTFTTFPSGDETSYQYQWQSSSDGISFADITPGTSATYNPVALTADTWFRVAVTATSTPSCPEYTNVVEVTVINFNQGATGSSQVICEGTAPSTLTSTTAASGDGTFSYEWFSSTDGVTYGSTPVATTESYSPGILNVDMWYYRRVTATVNGISCQKDNDEIYIQVNNVTAGSLTGEKTICNDGLAGNAGAITFDASDTYHVDGTASFIWYESVDGVVFTEVSPANNAENYSPVAAIDRDMWYKVMVTSTVGGVECYKETQPVRVTVVNFNPGTIGNDQVICSGTAPVTFSGMAPTGDGSFTYEWEMSTMGATDWNPWVTITGANNITYQSPALTADTRFTRKVISTMNAVSCSINTDTILVDVLEFSAGTIGSNQVICEGSAGALLTSTTDASGQGTFTYQWQISPDDVNYTNIAGAVNNTYQPETQVQDMWYRRVVTATLGGATCQLITSPVKITVNNILSVGSIGGEQTICENDTPLGLSVAGGLTSTVGVVDGTLSYEWWESVDGVETNYTLMHLADGVTPVTSEMFTPMALTADRWYKRYVVSTMSDGNGGTVECKKETGVIKITVNNFEPGSIDGEQTICEGSPASTINSVTPTGDGRFSYRWFSSITSETTGFNVIPGAVNETFYPGTLTQDTWFYREVTSTLNGTTCIENTNVVKITVINMTAGTIGLDETICSGDTPDLINILVSPGLDGGTVAYQWLQSVDNVNYQEITGATGNSYQPGALTQDTWYKLRVISTVNGTSCFAETDPIIKEVNNVYGGSIISEQAICNGGDPVAFISTQNGSGDGVITYRWEESATGAVGSFTTITGAEGITYDPGVLYSDMYYRRITISTLNGVACEAVSNTLRITVNVVMGGGIGSDQEICFESVPALLTSTDAGSGTGVVSYRWYRSDNNQNGTGYFAIISGANEATYQPVVLYADAWFKREVVSNLNGNVCTAESGVVHVTVNPRPVARLTGGETICPGESSIVNVEIPVGTGPFTLDLTSSVDGSVTTVTNYSSNDNITVTPTVTTNYTISRVVDANGCEITPATYPSNISGQATITVRLLPAVVTDPADVTVCEFAMTSFSVVATGTDVVYQWYENGAQLNDGGIYMGATSSTLNIYGVNRDMDGNSYYVVVSNCNTDVQSQVAMLNVNTIPEIRTQPESVTICSTQGTSFTVVATGTGVIYQWQINRQDGHGFVNVIDDAIFGGSDQSTLTLTNVPGSYNNYIFRVALRGACGGAVTYSNFVTLKVNMPPVVTRNPVNTALCDGTGMVTFVGSGSGMIDSLRWQVSTDGVAWTDIFDNQIYSGSMTQQLSIIDAPLAYTGNRYRLALKAYCETVYTDAAELTVWENPVVNLPAVPIQACGGVPVVIDGSPSGGSGTYMQHTWTGDVGPLNNYFVQSPTFNTSIPGTYNLHYRVMDSNGCVAEGDVQVVVEMPDATFTQNTIAGCTPTDVSFTKDMSSVARWEWDFGDGTTNSTDANPVHTFTNSNASSIEYYNVKLTVWSASGCEANFTQMITVYPEVDATFTVANDSICSGTPLQFTGVTGANTYFWDYGDGVSGAGTYNPLHVYINNTSTPITVTVSLTTRSFYGCESTETMDIVVMPMPVPQFSIMETPPYIYEITGNPLHFINNTGSGIWTYLWEFGDGSTSTEVNPVHTYTALGDYNVTLTVYNELCSSSVTREVSILPKAPVAGFENIPSDCAPLIIQTVNTSQETQYPGTTYLWDFGDGSFSTAENPSYTYHTAGIYRVELTVTGPGGVSTYSQVVEAYRSPNAYFEATPTKVFINDESVRMFNLSSGADYYLWEFGDGDTSHLQEPYHKYMDEGVFDITLWAYSENGCSDRYVLSPGVTVEPAGTLEFATVFRPSLDGPTTTSGAGPGEGLTEIDLPRGGEELDRYFFPPIYEKVIDYKLQVFNRLGTLIFQSDNINIPWDGYYRGELCTQGVYVWYVEGKYANGEPFREVGDITLLH